MTGSIKRRAGLSVVEPWLRKCPHDVLRETARHDFLLRCNSEGGEATMRVGESLRAYATAVGQSVAASEHH
jgi:hypothetical protein